MPSREKFDLDLTLRRLPRPAVHQGSLQEQMKPRRVLPAVKPPKPRRHLSPESRAKIAASQTKRWETRSRVLSEEAKRKISESQKARWARKHKVEDFDLPIDLPRNNAPHERRRSFAEIKTQPLGNGMYVGV